MNHSSLLILMLACIDFHVSMQRQVRQAPPPDWAPVQFRIANVSTTKLHGIETTKWRCSFKGRTRTARFHFELQVRQPKDRKMFVAAKATFRSDATSDSSELLVALKKALDAKTIPKGIKRTNTLVCDVAVLGANQSKNTDREGGGFSSKPPGNWITMKLFFVNDEGECFLNLNTKDGVGEFSIKDSDYGDVVLRELAKVL